MSWPTKIEGNQFSIAKLDPDTPLRLEVRTWSNVFQEGGRIAIEGYDANGARPTSDFGAIEVKSNPVTFERAHLQSIVDDFNADLKENWRALVVSARAECAAFYAKQAVEYAEKSANAANGIF